MLSNSEFVRQSLNIHLFFLRIMKEHSFFLQVGFTPRDAAFIAQADSFRMNFDRLLEEVIALSNGAVTPEVIQSGEIVTPYTLRAEYTSSYFTGVQIPTWITQSETQLVGGNIINVTPMLEQRIITLNQNIMNLVAGLIQFKMSVLSNVLSCKMFTTNYPLNIDHILREADSYLKTIQKIQNREDIENIDVQMEMLEQESFWNRIMAEHAKFTRGLLDPTENELISTANKFSNEFDRLAEETNAAMNATVSLEKATADSLEATEKIRDFNAQGTQGILNCEIRSIIIPLLSDHVLREANHYLRLLKKNSRRR